MTRTTASGSAGNIEEGRDPEKVMVFKDLQQMEEVGLVVPVGEEHMYCAAIDSTACGLTALGARYWRLAKERKLRILKWPRAHKHV